MSRYLLAVDGGGTKTDTVCVDESGNVVGRGLSGPTNLTSTSVGAASFNLIESIRQAIETLPLENQKGFPILVMGLAGIDSQKEYEEAFQTFSRAVGHYGIEKFHLVNDSVIALANGSQSQNAVILISGTGSICYGQDASGNTAKASGMDYLLSDQGSGYAIGRRVLREAVKSYDGRAPKSVLEQLVCEYFSIPTILDLKNEVYHPPLSKIEVADLARLCTTAFEQNDVVAKEIFDKTIDEIIAMISAVAEKLVFQGEFDIVLSGTISKIPYINENVLQKLAQQYRSAKVICPESQPVFGAVKIAQQKLSALD